jgi:phytoene synthase
LADVVSSTTEPALGAIRLAWWRERLEELDQGGVPAEPRLRAIARQLLGRGITGAELSKLEDAWLPLLQPFPWGGEVAEGLKLRGRILFAIGARLLGADPTLTEAPGELWSLVDGAQHCSDLESRELLMTEARKVLAGATGRMPRLLRSLTVLAAIAAAHLVRGGGSMARVTAALRHRLMGSLPRS